MKSEKIHIMKNSIQETLVVPLYGRKLCAENFPELYNDSYAKVLCESLDYDFSKQEAKKNSFFYKFTSLEAAMRQLDIIWEINDYLKKFPEACIINLGCGLDQSPNYCYNGKCSIINIDLPEVIAIRDQLIKPNKYEKNIAKNLNDHSWMDEIDGKNGVIFFAAGVFHYFKSSDVKSIILKLAEKFPGGCLIFDSVGKLGLKLMLSQTLKNMGINNIDAFFYLNNPVKELNFSEKIKVSSRAYMLGYYDMKKDNIHFLYRLLAEIGDNFLKMSINKIEFL